MPKSSNFKRIQIVSLVLLLLGSFHQTSHLLPSSNTSHLDPHPSHSHSHSPSHACILGEFSLLLLFLAWAPHATPLRIRLGERLKTALLSCLQWVMILFHYGLSWLLASPSLARTGASDWVETSCGYVMTIYIPLYFLNYCYYGLLRYVWPFVLLKNYHIFYNFFYH
jgi:hypothetical protein